MVDNISCPHCLGAVQLPEEFQGATFAVPSARPSLWRRPTDITATPSQPGSADDSASIQTGPAETLESRLSRSRSLRYATAEDADALAERIVTRGEFKPGGGLVLSVKVLLSLNLLMSAVVLGSEYLQYQLAARLVAGDNVPRAELDSNDARQMMLAFVHFGLFLVTGILFLIWFHRAYTNLVPLGSPTLTWSPGWAAGAWFVPILNLFRPVQIAQEIWRNSDPNVHPHHESLTHPATGSALIGFWWAAWIISCIVGQISTRLGRSADTPDSLLSATGVAMIAEVASIVAAGLALAVVINLDARQNARAEALHAMAGEDQAGGDEE